MQGKYESWYDLLWVLHIISESYRDSYHEFCSWSKLRAADYSDSWYDFLGSYVRIGHVAIHNVILVRDHNHER